MVGLDSFLMRKEELLKRREPLWAEWQRFAETADDTPENNRRGAELMAALHVMDGRLLEMDAWIDVLTKFPGVTRPDQLPTKGNMPHYVPVTQGKTDAQVTREREGRFKNDANNLVAVLPDTPIGEPG